MRWYGEGSYKVAAEREPICQTWLTRGLKQALGVRVPPQLGKSTVKVFVFLLSWPHSMTLIRATNQYPSETKETKIQEGVGGGS